MGKGYESITYYYEEFGRINLEKTAELTLQRAREMKINKVVIFTADGEGVFKMRELINENEPIEIVAVTFPNKRPFYVHNEDNDKETVYPKTSYAEVRRKFQELNIPLVQGVMPFEEIIIPGARDSNMKVIKETLNLICGGLQLCIQAVLMATDAGYIETGQEVISMTADTAIVTKGTLSEYLFHPKEGLDISEIICKPKTFIKGSRQR